jgi:hypothetical protein
VLQLILKMPAAEMFLEDAVLWMFCLRRMEQ